MSTTKHSFFANALHDIGAFLGGIFTPGHKFTIQDVTNGAATIAAVANIYGEIHKDTEGITDPALLATAIAKSVISHEGELPVNMQGEGLVTFIETACGKLTSLPLSEIEGIVKEEIARVKGV